MGVVPHAIAPLLHGPKGGKRHVKGQRWEEPSRSPPIPNETQSAKVEGFSSSWRPSDRNARDGQCRSRERAILFLMGRPRRIGFLLVHHSQIVASQCNAAVASLAKQRHGLSMVP